MSYRAIDRELIWNEELARSWADDSWTSRTWLAATRGRPRWFEPRELVGRYAGLSYTNGQCLRAACEAADRYPHLSVMAGFAFMRADRERGARHFWTVDRSGHVIDPALTARAVSDFVGYLGGPIELEHLSFLCRRAGLAMPTHLAERLAERKRGRGRRSIVAA